MAHFRFYDKLLVFFSFVTYVADVGTDVAVIVYFFSNGHLLWGILSLVFVVLATLTIQMFSFYWHVSDKPLDLISLTSDLLFIAPLQRYLRVLQLGYRSQQPGHHDDLSTAHRELNDVCILRLFETFLEAGPQLLLQLYFILLNLRNFHTLLGFSTIVSLLSVAWAVTAYTDVLQLAYKKLYKRTVIAMVAHMIWQTAMVTARVGSIVLLLTVAKGFLTIPLGIHVLVMLVWIVKLKPEFGTSYCERGVFILIGAIIHTFCFLNLKNGHTRYRMAFFYILSLLETIVFMTVWYMLMTDKRPAWFDVMAFSVVFGAFALGTVCMLLYYGCCHPSGPALIPNRKIEFVHQPAALTPSLYKPEPRRTYHQERISNSYSKKPVLQVKQQSIFDVSSTSAMINLWLTASLHLNKEGLAEKPDDLHLAALNCDYSGSNSKDDDQLHSYSYYGDALSPVDAHVSSLGSTSIRSPNMLDQSQNSMTMHEALDKSASAVDNLYGSKPKHGNYICEKEEQFLPNYNHVVDDMFSHSKDHLFVSDTSCSDTSLSKEKDQVGANGNVERTLSPQNKNVNCYEQDKCITEIRPDINVDDSNDCLIRQSPCSHYISRSYCKQENNLITEIRPANNSPVMNVNQSVQQEYDEDRLPFEASIRSQLPGATGSGSSLNHMLEGSNAVLKVAPDASKRSSALSLTFIAQNENPLNGNMNGGHYVCHDTDTVSSYIYKQQVNKSSESINSHRLSGSELLSSSDVSVELPEGSSCYQQIATQSDGLQGQKTACKENSKYRKKLLPLKVDSKSRSRSLDSRDFTIQLDQQSFHLSEHDLSSSKIGYPSSHFSQHDLSTSKIGHPSYHFSQHDLSSSKIGHSSSHLLQHNLSSSKVGHPSSHLSQHELSSTNRKLSSFHSNLETFGHTSTASSVYKSENSKTTNFSPAYRNSVAQDAHQYQSSTPAVENEISSICFAPSDVGDGQMNLDSSSVLTLTGSLVKKSSLSTFISDISGCSSKSSGDETLSHASDLDFQNLFRFEDDKNMFNIQNASSLTYILGVEDSSPLAGNQLSENIDKFEMKTGTYEQHISGSDKLYNMGRIKFGNNKWAETQLKLNAVASERHNVEKPLMYENTDNFKRVVDFANSPYKQSHFKMGKWRNSHGNEIMKKEVFSGRDKLTPKTLEQLQSKTDGPIKKLYPLNISEYSGSPYKFRKAVDENVYQNVKEGNSFVTNEYDNTSSLAARDVNCGNVLGSCEDNNGRCPLATPESLSDSLSLDQTEPTNDQNNEISCANIVRNEMYQDCMSDGQTTRSNESSRNSSPINASGFNSAFKPVKARNSVDNKTTILMSWRNVDNEITEIRQTKHANAVTFAVLDEIQDQNQGSDLSRNKDRSLVYMNRAATKSEQLDRRSDASQSLGDSDGSSFQWSQNTGTYSLTDSESSNQTPRNFLQLAGSSALGFSIASSQEDTPQGSQHSRSDSISMEDTENHTNYRHLASSKVSRPHVRQPLKALENTPVFSPIHRQDKTNEWSSNKRFMSTPKLSSGSEINILTYPDVSTRKSPDHHRLSIGACQNSENTSMWSSQSNRDIEHTGYEENTFSSLSKSTYI